MIKKSILYLASHFFICTFIFLCIQKPLFMFYNWGHGASACSFADWARIYSHGISLDFATAGYFTVVPILIILIYNILPTPPNRHLALAVYNGVIAFFLALVTLADAALYEFWEFKLDRTVFFYLNDPKNAFASVSFGYLVVRLLALLALTAAYWLLLQLPVRRLLNLRDARRGNRILGVLVVLLAGGLVFATIRGLRIWPNTPGRAFYSKTAFHNHAALNPVFNLAYTSMQKKGFAEQFNFFAEEKRRELYAPLFPAGSVHTEKLLTKEKPNILLLVLEGFGAVFIEELGGMKEVAPNMSRLLRESINFSRCDCSSFRTDRGIVCVLSGYPGQPTSSIMRYSHKIQALPGLPKTLREHGYDTQVLYASDMTFFNMSDYFIAVGHDKLVSQDDFPSSDRTTKWGVPDHKAFEWLYEDIRARQADARPWYTTFLTISSHAPWDVPYRRLEDDKLNAFAYVDQCVGDFIDRLKASPAWDNLLVVVTADHGFNQQEVASPSFPHIPFFLLGGAVGNARTIDRIVCQTDIPATLLGQLGIPHDLFTFSRDVLSETYTYPFSFNTFNNGFNFRDTTGCTVYDNTASRALFNVRPDGSEDLTPDALRREQRGKAILQTLYDDMDRR